MSNRVPQGGKQLPNKGDNGDKPPPKKDQQAKVGESKPAKIKNPKAPKNEDPKKNGKNRATDPPQPGTVTGSQVVPPSAAPEIDSTGIQPLQRRTITGFSNASGGSDKSPTSVAMTTGDVKPFNAAGGDNGAASADKILSMILKRMIITPEPVEEGEIPVKVRRNNKSSRKPENWIRWTVPYGRFDEDEAISWTGLEEGYTFEQACSEDKLRHRETWLENLKQEKGKKPSLCIIIRFTAMMMEIGDVISVQVSGILGEAVRLTQSFDVSVDLELSSIEAPMAAEYEYKTMIANLVRVMIMLARKDQSDDRREVAGAYVAEGDPNKPFMSGARDDDSLLTAQSTDSAPFVKSGGKSRPTRQDSDDSGQNRDRRGGKQPQREELFGGEAGMDDREMLKMGLDMPLEYSPPSRKFYGDNYSSGPLWKKFGGGI